MAHDLRRIHRAAMIVNPQLQRMQAKQMVGLYIGGMPIRLIAERFNYTPDTVRRRIRMARDQGWLDDLEDKFLNELVPLAMSTYKDAMTTNKDTTVAKDVMNHFSRIMDRETSQNNNTDTMTLEVYRELRQKREPANAALDALPEPSRVLAKLTQTRTQVSRRSDGEANVPTNEHSAEGDVVSVIDGPRRAESLAELLAATKTPGTKVTIDVAAVATDSGEDA